MCVSRACARICLFHPYPPYTGDRLHYSGSNCMCCCVGVCMLLLCCFLTPKHPQVTDSIIAEATVSASAIDTLHSVWPSIVRYCMSCCCAALIPITYHVSLITHHFGMSCHTYHLSLINHLSLITLVCHVIPITYHVLCCAHLLHLSACGAIACTSAPRIVPCVYV